MSDVEDRGTETPAGAGGQTARIAIVAVVAVIGVVAGIVLSSGGSEPAVVANPGAIGASEPDTVANSEPADVPDPEPAYAFAYTSRPDPPDPGGTIFTFTITEAGQPVTGADVRLAADMTEMSHAGIGSTAVEVEPGTYQVELTFPMRGGYAGDILIQEAGRPKGTLRFTFEVE